MPPRPLRLDAPGCIHHVMMRGVDGRAVFMDDLDREFFASRFTRVLGESGAICLAWAFMTNHVHLLILTGDVHLSKVMHRVNLLYATHFNRRHDRRGYLFQSRFISRLAGDEADVMGLIRYVHLNPVRGGVIPSLSALAHYPWTGHPSLLGLIESRPFHDSHRALRFFDEDDDRARARVGEWMKVDEEERARTMEELANVVALEFGIEAAALRSRCKTRAASRARAAFARRARSEMGLRPAEIARWLDVSRSSVTRALRNETTQQTEPVPTQHK